ncbi:MAG: transketolase [Mobilicoccus sp.]|nr:transketolase [Mobilicoccus sp.]
MPLSDHEWRELENTAHRLRRLTLDTVAWAGSGHIGGSLSSTDVLTVLYHHVMNFSAEQMDDPDRDRFVLSKGHIGVGFAPVLADLGCFPLDWLTRYNHTGSPLGMHPDSNKVPGVEVATGSLGHGLSLAVGMAVAARLQGRDLGVYCLMGDGECNEGSVWEAAMSASHYRCGRLVAFVDRNHQMIDGPTEDIMSLEPFAQKWEAFGWHTQQLSGHDIPAIVAAIEAAHEVTDAPSMIILDTVKGEGIDFIEGDYTWHYGAFDAEKKAAAEAALDAHHERRLARISLTHREG